MSVGIIDGFEDVHIYQNQSVMCVPVFVNLQNPVEGASVHQIRQGVIFRLMANQTLGFQIFLIDLIIGLRQILQLLCTHNRKNRTFPDTFVIINQRFHTQPAHHVTHLNHQKHQTSYADAQLPIHILNLVLCVGLSVFGLLCHDIRAGCDTVCNLQLTLLILTTADQHLRFGYLFRITERSVVVRQLHLLHLLRTGIHIHSGGLRHQMHGLKLRIH